MTNHITDVAVDALLTAGRAGLEILDSDSIELIDGGVGLRHMNPEAALEALEQSSEPCSGRLEAALEVLKELAPHYIRVTDALSDAGIRLANEIEADSLEETWTASRLESIHEQIRDMRDGYCDGDMPGAIEKLYQQVSDLIEGN